MPSSTSSSEPCLAGPCEQELEQARAEHRRKLRGFLIKSAIFLVVIVAMDQFLGWVLIRGLDKYYGLDRPADVLCVGHSHTILGIDGDRLQNEVGVSVTKYAANGVNTWDRLAMIRHYFSRVAQRPKVVVYDVDAWSFTGEGLSANSYRQFYPYIGDAQMRQYVRENEPSKTEFWWHEMIKTLRFGDNDVWLSIRGYMNYRTNLKIGSVDLAKLQREVDSGKSRKIRFDRDNIKCFEETMKCVRSSGAKLVLVYIPTIDVFNNSDRASYDRAVAMFEDYAARNEGVYFLDYSKEYESRHDLFFDPIHMNPKGQVVVTERLAGDLKRILGMSAPTARAGGAKETVSVSGK
jgi:hypothetical protein